MNMNICASGVEFLCRCWHALQIKYHGRYSLDRLVALARYHHNVSRQRKAAAISMTPLPALIAIIVTDIPKLAPPELGLRHSYVFWFRAWFTGILIIATLVQQLKCFLPTLRVTSSQVGGIAVFVATADMLFAIAISTQIGFPVPFTITVTGPLSISCLVVFGYTFWGNEIRLDPKLQRELIAYTIFISLQLTLTIVYPLFAFAFTQTESVIGQTLLVCVLPIIKLLMKGWLASTMTEAADLKPEFLIFNVEIFHAMFVACCMQNAKSGYTTAVIIGLDLFHNWRALREVKAIVNTLTEILRTKTASVHGQDIHVSEFDLVQSTLHLLHDEPVFQAFQPPPEPPQRRPHRVLATVAGKIGRVKPSPLSTTAIRPAEPAPNALRDAIGAMPTSIDAELQASLDALALPDKIAFVRHALGLLHVTEFVVLAEYVEVVVPLVYATYLAVVTQLPNRKYYPQLRVMSDSNVALAIQNVLVYASLELLSFVGLDLLLRRQLRFPPLRHLAFVLDHHWWLLPGKLVLWVIFVAQCSLEHYGADYTFQFAWLKSKSYDNGR